MLKSFIHLLIISDGVFLKNDPKSKLGSCDAQNRIPGKLVQNSGFGMDGRKKNRIIEWQQDRHLLQKETWSRDCHHLPKLRHYCNGIMQCFPFVYHN